MPERMKRLPTIDWSKLKILVVDDQRTAAVLLKSLLKNIGIHTTNIDMAFSYEEAIRYCQNNHYQLLLTDYHLNKALNGNELTTLLRQKKLLSSDCGILVLSGDHSREVILTTLSIEPDSFLSKPITIAGLKQKLEEICNDCAQRKPIYAALENNDIPLAIRIAKQQLSEYGHHHKIEGLLLDLLIEQKDWEQVKRLTTLLIIQNPTHKISLVDARISHHEGDINTAINKLQQLVARSPLYVDAYDFLSLYQEENKQYHDALNSAKQALNYTPSVTHRVLQVAQLAANLNDSESLIKAGKVLASHLPIIDVSWVTRFAEFTAIFEQLYFAQTSHRLQRQLIQQLKGIHQLAIKRLLPIQQPFLTLYGQITLARFLLANDQPLKAKRRLMVSLSAHFDAITKLPSVILIEILPALFHLGEAQLIFDIYQVFKQRDRIDGHSQNRLTELKKNTTSINSIRALMIDLKEAKILLEQDHIADLVTLQHYNDIISRYPLCSEAHLGRLQSLYQLNLYDQDKIKESIKAINMMPLPSALAEWRNNIFQCLLIKMTKTQHNITIDPYLRRYHSKNTITTFIS
ncbi:MAG: response regulator [Photobacterium frigidiphilum]|uniref:response regulator n=1 Tax=Photobacterium frigidiphilum TaxID=264736 RepID=UPI0030018068